MEVVLMGFAIASRALVEFTVKKACALTTVLVWLMECV
jgi:hypothetical protein